MISLFAGFSALKSFNSNSEDWVDVGTGSCKDATGEASFRVVLWPAAAAWRERLELPPKDFHITLGFQDGAPWICAEGASKSLSITVKKTVIWSDLVFGAGR